MEIKIKSENGVIKVDAKVMDVFKKYILPCNFVKYSSFNDIAQYRLYGVVNNGGNIYKVAEIIIVKNIDNKLHVYEIVRDNNYNYSNLMEVSFDGNDILYTSPVEAVMYRDKLNNAKKKPETPKHETEMPVQSEKTVTVPEAYKDIVSTILDVVSRMQNEQTANNKQEEVKTPEILEKSDVEHMSLADKVRLDNMQQQLDNCYKNIERLKNSIQEQQKELNLWIEESNRYADKAEQLIKQYKY